MTSINSHAGPSLAPPSRHSASAVGTAGHSAPTMTGEQLAAIAVEAPVAPTLMPPGAEVGAEAGVAGTWRNNMQIDAVWCMNETRNAFVHVAGLGWRRIYNGRDGAFQALVSLASQARQTNRIVNFREEADGMIYEIYVW
jgi:hypothetical protein